VVDYTRDDVTAERDHDVVLDTVGSQSTRTLATMVHESGTVVLVGGGRGRWVEPGGQVIRGLALSPLLRGRVLGVFDVDSSAEALATISAMVEAGDVTPFVERAYGLDEVVAAMEHLETGHVSGKLVVVRSVSCQLPV
jgi:NADPH:quinone reductase-like Zn-dependent oxidoreductase